MLCSPEKHEPLTETPGNDERVRDRIRSVVADAESAFDATTLWPVVEGWDDAGGRAEPA